MHGVRRRVCPTTTGNSKSPRPRCPRYGVWPHAHAHAHTHGPRGRRRSKQRRPWGREQAAEEPWTLGEKEIWSGTVPGAVRRDADTEPPGSVSRQLSMAPYLPTGTFPSGPGPHGEARRGSQRQEQGDRPLGGGGGPGPLPLCPVRLKASLSRLRPEPASRWGPHWRLGWWQPEGSPGLATCPGRRSPPSRLSPSGKTRVQISVQSKAAGRGASLTSRNTSIPEKGVSAR